jgi:HTH-type transcriptional regulator, transcriptional repressor of NAD biosynthesis genes
MVKAFVFGKFMPFHKGHEAMIKFALQHCDVLNVLICCSDKEHISGKIRKNWIAKTFAHDKKVKVQIFNYLESELPNTSVSSKDVSQIWAEKFKILFPKHSLLITSEPYGNFVADFMHIKHLAFDFDRNIVPISASMIQADLFGNWQYLPDSVKPYYAIKVVILGTESTGKSTLTQQLTTHFKCNSVSEVGRDIVENSNNFCFEDLKLIAETHANNIEKAVLDHSPLIIIDTDIHTTLSYSKFVFNKKILVSKGIYAANKAQLYLYLNNDAPFFQDGTRFSEDLRNKLDGSHRQILKEKKVDFVEISGNWKERFEKAVSYIMAINIKNQKIKKNI